MPTKIRFNDRGLVPAIAQDAKTGQVLMVAYMDKEALDRTVESGQAWFYSRSRGEYWHKGATSGHYLNVLEVRPDCDGDAILLKVDPTGPACHTGNVSCFFQEFDRYKWEAEGQLPLSNVLERLAERVAQRRMAMPSGSYTAGLFQAGRERIAQKVIEEAGETALAAMAGSKERTRAEVADLFFHTLVLLEDVGLTLDDVAKELEARRR